MNFAQRIGWRFQLLAVILAIAAPCFLLSIASDVKQQIESSAWPTTAGIVERTELKSSFGSKGSVSYTGSVVYRYAVNGKEYEADRANFRKGPWNSDPTAALAAIDARYSPGDQVVVHHHPSDAKVAVLESGISTQSRWELIIASAVWLLSGIASVFVVRVWIQEWRNAAETSDSSHDRSTNIAATTTFPSGYETARQPSRFTPKTVLQAALATAIGILPGAIFLASGEPIPNSCLVMGLGAFIALALVFAKLSARNMAGLAAGAVVGHAISKSLGAAVVESLTEDGEVEGAEPAPHVSAEEDVGGWPN